MKNELKCSTLECYSIPVARSVDNGRLHCIECAIKIARQFGPESVIAITGYDRLPWEWGGAFECEHCGITITPFLIGSNGKCPKCRKHLSRYKKGDKKDG